MKKIRKYSIPLIIIISLTISCAHLQDSSITANLTADRTAESLTVPLYEKNTLKANTIAGYELVSENVGAILVYNESNEFFAGEIKLPDNKIVKYDPLKNTALLKLYPLVIKRKIYRRGIRLGTVYLHFKR